MNGLAQVWHVAKKDLRQQRWPIAVYAALVTVATWSVAMDLETVIANGLFVMVAGVILQTLIIQGDSPANPGAMWITLPLGSKSVFASKLVVVALTVMIVGLIGQSIAIATLDVPMRRLGGLILDSVWPYAAILVVTALIGALTRDLKSFLLVLVGWFLASQFYLPFITRLLGQESRGFVAPWIVDSAVSVLILCVIADAYRRRRMLRSAVLGAATLLAAPFTNALKQPAHAASVVGEYPALADSLRPRIETQPWRIGEFYGGEGRQTVGFPVTLAGTAPGVWYGLVESSLRLELPDGSVTQEEVDSRFVWLTRGPLQLSGDVTWLQKPPSDAGGGWPQVLMIPALGKFNRDGAKATLTGTVVAYRPVEVASLPVRPGASFVRNGRRLTLITTEVRATGMSEGPEVAVRMTVARPGSDLSRLMGRTPWQAFGYALVDASGREAVPLIESRWNTSGGSGLVVPGSEGERQLLRLQYRAQRRDSTPQLKGDWTSGSASLRLIDWEPIGSFPITVTTTVTKP